jgi:hypothetical protein
MLRRALEAMRIHYSILEISISELRLIYGAFIFRGGVWLSSGVV